MARTEKKSISVKGTTYRRLKTLCEKMGVPIARYCDDLVNKKLDEKGFRNFDERPLTLWECRRGSSHFFVAARNEAEAAGYVSNVSGGHVEDIEVTSSQEKHDTKNLIPGILVPDEVRSALAG